MMNRNNILLCAVLSLFFAVERQSFADSLDAYENQSFSVEIYNKQKEGTEKHRATVRIGNVDRNRKQANCLLTISPPLPGFPKRWEFKGEFYRPDRNENDGWYLSGYKKKRDSNGYWQQDGKQPGPKGWQVSITIGSWLGGYDKMTEFSADGSIILSDESDMFDGMYQGHNWER